MILLTLIHYHCNLWSTVFPIIINTIVILFSVKKKLSRVLKNLLEHLSFYLQHYKTHCKFFALQSNQLEDKSNYLRDSLIFPMKKLMIRRFSDDK